MNDHLSVPILNALVDGELSVDQLPTANHHLSQCPLCTSDALYHSLQVFELAREERPYDEEFLLAALLHDVGKAIDPHDHVATGVEALRGSLSGLDVGQGRVAAPRLDARAMEGLVADQHRDAVP